MTKREFSAGLKARVKVLRQRVPGGKCLGHLGGGYLLFRGTKGDLFRLDVIGVPRWAVHNIMERRK